MKLGAVIGGILDRLDNSEDMGETRYCSISRQEGRREEGRKGERNGGREESQWGKKLRIPK